MGLLGTPGAVSPSSQGNKGRPTTLPILPQSDPVALSHLQAWAHGSGSAGEGFPPRWTSCSELSCSLTVPQPAVLWDAVLKAELLGAMHNVGHCSTGEQCGAVLCVDVHLIGSLRLEKPSRIPQLTLLTLLLMQPGCCWPFAHTAGSCSAPDPFQSFCPKP